MAHIITTQSAFISTGHGSTASFEVRSEVETESDVCPEINNNFDLSVFDMMADALKSFRSQAN